MYASPDTLSSLTATRDLCFNWLLASSGVVVLGVALEGPEVIHEARKVLRGIDLGSSRWITLLSLIGWILVVLGIVGEGISEALVSRADGNIQAFNDSRLAELTREAGDSKQSAHDAESDAAQARIDAGAAHTLAQSASDIARPAKKTADAAKAKADATSREADISQRRIASLNGEEVALAQKATDLEKYLSTRMPAISAATHLAIAKMHGGVLHLQSAPDEESQATAISIQAECFPFIAKRGFIPNWRLDKDSGAISGGSTLFLHRLLGPFANPGIQVDCGVGALPDLPPSPPERLKECIVVRDSITDDLINSGISAIANLTDDVPEGDLRIQVWPKPTFEATQRIIDVHKEMEQRQKELKSLSPPNPPR